MTKLEKKFEKVNNITIHTWSMVMLLVEYLNNGDAMVSKKTWAEDRKNEYPDLYPLDLKDINTWSTFDRTCIELDFHYSPHYITCDVEIYDGNNLHGHRENLRFTADLTINPKIIKKLKSNIESRFNRVLEEEYDRFLLEQKRIWKKNREKEIIGK